jgi:two-component system capsular synthesis response regulator RcsB
MRFNKVLIAEDYESTSMSVRKIILELGITNHTYTYYCDEALMHIKKNLDTDAPFDLLITDLSFVPDHREQHLKDGRELVQAVRELQPDLKILVFSAEHKAESIDALFRDLKINGYVRKARHDAQELKLAIEAISNDKTYVSQDLRLSIRKKNTHEFSKFDITIISLLSKGMLQKDIPDYLQQKEIKPSGLSSIEKRLNLMKESLGFTKNEQLVAYCKDFGLI